MPEQLLVLRFFQRIGGDIKNYNMYVSSSEFERCNLRFHILISLCGGREKSFLLHQYEQMSLSTLEKQFCWYIHLHCCDDGYGLTEAESLVEASMKGITSENFHCTGTNFMVKYNSQLAK